MRAAFDKLRKRINMVINIEGLAFGHIYHAGIAVRRLHITATTSGGHSWLHFGRPSAIHGIVQLGSRITAIKPPTSPRTTYNIGIIEGGQSINTIAATAALWLDLRSEDTDTLHELEQQVRTLVDEAHMNDLDFSVELVGNRPAGHLPNSHVLVEGAMRVLDKIGYRSTLETGSTDGNIPLAAGYPTITIGITRGGNAHRLDEYIETGFVAPGMKQLVTLILAVSTYQTMVK
jgi:acetylornithine deacetylase/succinyl-diaminopimelate desuccinylase-like protein